MKVLKGKLDDQLEVYGDNTYRYNTDGYLEEKITPEGSTLYAYGTLGELLSISTTEKEITYIQNAQNQRTAKLINGVVVEKYLWLNLTTLLAVYDGNDNLKQRFMYADHRMPIIMIQNQTEKYYLHYDQVGSLRAVSDLDHKVVKEIVYDTFGNILTDSNTSLTVPFGFAGGLYDTDTKLTRFGYRDYDSYAGKWTAKDPIGFNGGDSNLYGYVLGGPVGFVDPNGLLFDELGMMYAAGASIVAGGVYTVSAFDIWLNTTTPTDVANKLYKKWDKQCRYDLRHNTGYEGISCGAAKEFELKSVCSSEQNARSAAWLPNTFGGGPISKNVGDIVGNEIIDKARSIK